MMFSQIKALKSGEWSESEDQFILDNYRDLRNKTMAEYLGRPLHSVDSRVRTLQERGDITERRKTRRKDCERHEAEILQNLRTYDDE